MTTFAAMMDLEPHGPDTWVGSGPQYPWGGLYGGQIVAQALQAAGRSVEERFEPHSLHAYFIRRGDAAEPIRFEVDRDRNGRSFCTRRVVARQSVGVILNMSCSFHVAEDGPVVPAVPRAVAAPDGIDDDSWSPVFERRQLPASDRGRGRAGAWMRFGEEGLDGPLTAACALAYLSDDLPTEAVFAVHPELDDLGDPADEQVYGSVVSASLDHALWFHRLAPPSAWQLHDLSCQAIGNARGLARGSVFAADGGHLADVAQQILIRLRG